MSKFMTVSMPESEKARFRDWTDSINKELNGEVQKVVVHTIHIIVRRAQMFAPSNKKVGAGGFLQGSIHPVIAANQLGGIVRVGRNYGPYQEFGTGDKVVAPADVREYALEFKGRGLRKVNMRAQPYLFPAVRIGLKEMSNKLKNLGFKEV